MWWQQYKKELMGNRTELLFLLGFFLVWTLFLLSRAGVWEPAVVIALYGAPPSGILPLWALWASVQLYRQEWRENTSYLMLSLPVRARVITSAKLAALLTGVLGFALLFAVGGWLLLARTGLWGEVFQRHVFSLIPWEYAVKMSLLTGGAVLAALVIVALVAQFAYVFSRLFSRLQGLVMVWTWVLSFWLMARVVDVGGRLLAFMPDFHLRLLTIHNQVPEFEMVTVESGPLWALALFVAGLYTLLNAVLERAVEV